MKTMMKRACVTAVACLLGATGAYAQCDGSADIPANPLIEESWSNIMTGGFDALLEELSSAGVTNGSIENSLRSLERQRPDGFAQCTVLLRNQISDRLVREWVLFGEDGGIGFFATMTVVTIDGADRVIGFNLDSNIDPTLYNH
ncbi:hypothetical protein KO498_02230 [Lentibacter algarum]|uniref:hypothetical protein n=1 Tax=Lentibacter algarum TaxID=576131 RepID=UPI001C067EDD|nr:hypothetical protein [Lentibacter algarum]MBU2980622.1 hypothetical protein [Lentibacter algarum]